MVGKKKSPQIILTDSDEKEKKLIIHPSLPIPFPALLIDRKVILPGMIMKMVIVVQDHQLPFIVDVMKEQLGGAMPMVFACVQAKTEEAISVRHIATLGYVRSHSEQSSNGLAIVELLVEAIDRIRLVSFAPYVALKDSRLQQAATVYMPAPQISDEEWGLAVSITARQSLVESLNLWLVLVKSMMRHKKDSHVPLTPDEEQSFLVLSRLLHETIDDLMQSENLPEQYMLALARFVQAQASLNWLAQYLEEDTIAEHIDTARNMSTQNSEDIFEIIEGMDDMDDDDGSPFIPPTPKKNVRKNNRGDKVEILSIEELRQQSQKLIEQLDKLIHQLSSTPEK